MRAVRAVLLLAAVVGLCGCRAPPVRYYVLSVVHPVDAAVPAAPAATGVLLPVRVDRVRLPGELDRSQLIRRIDANRLQVEADSRWAAPLDEMIRRVLSADLMGRLPPGMVADPYEPLPRSEVRPLSIDIHELYGDPRCGVSLSATWVLTQPQARALSATEDIHVPGTGHCPEAQAATMSRAVADLSDRVAAAVIRLGSTKR